MDQLNANLERHLKVISQDIGPRHIGSPQEQAAADYIEQEFRKIGLDTEREYYPVTGWNFRSFRFKDSTTGTPIPTACACFFSNSLHYEGPLCWLQEKDIRSLESCPVQSRLCMVELYVSEDSLMNLNALADRLDALGAAGAIFISSSEMHTSRSPSSKIQRSPFLKQMGTCAVSEEGAIYLASHRKNIFRLDIEANPFSHQSCNVVAHYRHGTGGKGVFGAHYDTAPFTPGASDNGSGIAMLIESARLTAAANTRMSADFAAFSSEEYVPEKFPPGSDCYVKHHLKENLQWYINLDSFGRFTGEPLLIAGAHCHNLKLQSAFRITDSTPPGDCLTFLNSKIPSFSYSDFEHFRLFHTALDTFDTMDVETVAQGVQDSMNLYRQLEEIF